MQTKFQQYDFVFLGAGCASYSLLLRLLDTAEYKNARVLLIDQNGAGGSERTWCFWEKENGYFDELVIKKWPQLIVADAEAKQELVITPYEYKMIRGVDFFSSARKRISSFDRVEYLSASVSSYKKEGDTLIVEFADGQKLSLESKYVFNSIAGLPQLSACKKLGAVHLLQHFKGWFIETEKEAFDSEVATLMDFSVSQQHGTAFVYLLPISSTKALVEYTLFSESILVEKEYDETLREYLSGKLGDVSYKIADQEFGIIPMNDDSFAFNCGGVYQLGTSGGQTKGSTGYTFQFIQRQSAEIVAQLVKGASLNELTRSAARFRFYDSILLHVLAYKYYPGAQVFLKLFKRNKAQNVLLFLDNKTTLPQEIAIISKLPWAPFLKALGKKIIGRV